MLKLLSSVAASSGRNARGLLAARVQARVQAGRVDPGRRPLSSVVVAALHDAAPERNSGRRVRLLTTTTTTTSPSCAVAPGAQHQHQQQQQQQQQQHQQDLQLLEQHHRLTWPHQHLARRLFHTSRVVFNEVHTIKCPQLSESLSEGDIRLVKAPGDQVAVDDVIAEIETDKTSIPIHSSVAGVIEAFCVEDGATVKPGQDIVRVRLGASSGGGAAAPAAAAPEPTASAPPPPPPAAPAGAPEPSGAQSGEVRTVKCPQLSESLSEGDIRLVKAPGDKVAVDDVVAEVETDKTAIPINAPVAGVIEAFCVEDGSTVKPGQDIVKIRVGGSGGAAPAPAVSAAAPAPPPAAAAAAPTPAGPPSTATPPPVPPKASQPMSVAAPKDIKKPAFDMPAEAATPAAGSRTETRVKMNRMRQRIAERLKDAQNTYAMLTTFNEVDMTNITALRAKYKDNFQKKHGVKLGFMSAFVKASAYALRDQPVVNAVIDGNETIYRDYVDISVAVSTPKGLVVPVIRNVDQLDYAGIEKTIAALGEKARTGSLAIEDMDGGTFTISNGGVFGSMFGTPIINPPQSAILGMHAIQQRAVVINNEIKIRPMMYICLTYDHRLIDGREAVTFLKKIKEAVEEPACMFLAV